MATALRPLLVNRNVLLTTVVDELRKRYSATVLGAGWNIIQPLMFLALYGFVYVRIFKITINGFSSVDYILLIFTGLVPFLAFSEAMTAGAATVVDNKSLVKNTLFPIELAPVRVVLVAMCGMLVGLTMLIGVLAGRGHALPTQLLLPLILVPHFLFMVGFVWVLSIVAVFFRDMLNLISAINLFLMMISPIGFTQEMIPSELMPVMTFNPLYYIIMVYRGMLYTGNVPWDLLGIFSIASVIMFLAGYFVFSRLKVICADYL
ncbi:MAG TPA: ABC transporter permease [Hyphomonadaceae bacterium]|jgi:lipopolysaccharide transport system permease protein|nr:ABC transporter permease [Hyphomonadaceae bacterium]